VANQAVVNDVGAMLDHPINDIPLERHLSLQTLFQAKLEHAHGVHKFLHSALYTSV